MLIVLKKQLKKNRKKGFTLVEVIVVLVILAILAAIAIPALTGYIDKANDRALISEGRNIQVALQEIITTAYGDEIPVNWTAGTTNGTSDISISNTTHIVDEINTLVGQTYVGGDITQIGTVGSLNTAIGTFAYKKADGKFVGYNSTRTPKYKIAATDTAAITS